MPRGVAADEQTPKRRGTQLFPRLVGGGSGMGREAIPRLGPAVAGQRDAWEKKEFRGGADLVSGVEREVHTGPGRVLTSAGLNCMHNDINGIRADSAELRRSGQGVQGFDTRPPGE